MLAQALQSKYCLRELSAFTPRVENSFQINQPLALMQQGLPAAYEYSDYVSVYDTEINRAAFAAPLFKNFKSDVANIIISNFREYVPNCARIIKTPQIPQLLISSFDTEVWNHIGKSPVDIYKPAWTDPARSNIVDPNFPDRKKKYFKFDTKMFFQIKKNVKGANQLTTEVQKLLTKYNFQFDITEGESKEFCGVANSIIAGRFNDGVEKPKDPYTFYLHCLVGYDKPQHLGGSYLLAQKCPFDWKALHSSNESLPGIIGRNEILQGSSIFSQNHCPRSHIRLSRIKDEYGNPVTLHRESKAFTSSTFHPEKVRNVTDNINPEEGIIFLGYHKNPFTLEKILLNQLGNNAQTSYQDGLLNMLRVDHGNILYTPSIVELLGCYLKRFNLDEKKVKFGVATLSHYHQVRWLKSYKKNEDDEQNFQKTGNPYFLYSRAGYLRRMSQSHQYSADLNPPSPRILRIISRTFSLWQDTWYFDRRQREVGHLQEHLISKPAVTQELQSFLSKCNFGFDQYMRANHTWDYEKIPNVIRNGLAVHFGLGHILSTMEYGCRGPIDKSFGGQFGGNTFHLQPEDILAGGEANLTFGQGKHVVQYLTESEKQSNWRNGMNLSGHSGIGHVVAYMEEIMENGLDYVIQQFVNEANRNKNFIVNGVTDDAKKHKFQLFVSSIIALLGMKRYFQNYANYARLFAESLKPTQKASIESLKAIQTTMSNLSSKAPSSLREGAQLALSIFICLHITGQPVSIGRLDHILRKWAKPIEVKDGKVILNQQDQDIIDSFWIKVGEKANFNKGFFEDHQKWGNLAMGGNSAPYPQGASFNQWGHQLTVGGTEITPTGVKPFYNSVTVHCLRAARTIPVNAPCLGLRILPESPQFIIEQAAKAILAGGAHPILLNQDKIVQGLRQSGNYKIDQNRWDSLPLVIDGRQVVVPYNHWKTEIDEAHVRDYTSDGCHEFLIVGRSWFWLGGGCVLQPLEYVLNVGKSLLQSGPRYIHGMRNIYRDRELSLYNTYAAFEQQFMDTFEDLMNRNFKGELSGFSNLTKVCPATLLNAFTADMRKRGSDFYANGTQYKIFCPQYTGVANLVNSLWNIKQLVFVDKVTTLEEIRNCLLVNWGDELVEPFVPATLPENMKNRLKNRCEMLRQLVWNQPKFGLDKNVTDFGLKITQKLSKITRRIFEQPTDDMLRLFKSLTNTHGTESAPFGFQYLPGGGTFENYEDFGTGIGASFDGRKKGQTLAQDYSPQNFLMDKNIGDYKYEFKEVFARDVIDNYSHGSLDCRDPQLFSGAVLDLNIDESYKLEALIGNVRDLANGKGTNLTTITVCSRAIMEEARRNTDRDLLRCRMGGWSEFLVAMFPSLLEQHIRRVREIHPAITPLKKQEQYKDPAPSKKLKTK